MSDSDSMKLSKLPSRDQSYALVGKSYSGSIGYKAIRKIKQVLKAAAQKITKIFTAREPSSEALNAYKQQVDLSNEPNGFRKLPDNIVKPGSAVAPEVRRIEELRREMKAGRMNRSVSHVDFSP